MSWSAGREPGTKDASTGKKQIAGEDKRKLECIRQINGLLNHLADDEYLQDDMKDPRVRVSLDHWTGIKRLPPEEFERKFGNDKRVASVCGKLKMLQSACHEASMKVPLDHMLQGKRELDSYTLTTTFGTDFCIRHDLTRPLTPKNTRVTKTDTAGIPRKMSVAGNSTICASVMTDFSWFMPSSSYQNQYLI